MALVASQVAESRSLEFKRDLPGNTDADLKEFLADVTSLANAQGGDLVFGIEEKQGVAGAVSGVAVSDQDGASLRLENILRDGIEPRLVGVHLRWISLQSGGSVLVVRVPASLAAPHRIRFRNSSRFYSRNSRGKYEMDTHELRVAFTASENLPARLRNFHTEAVKVAREDRFPFRLEHDPAAVVSIIPLSFLRELRDLPISHDTAVLPVQPSGLDWLYTLDGIVAHTPLTERGRVRSYALTHRSGRVDVAWTIGGMRDLPRGRTKLVWPKSFRDGLVGISRSSAARLAGWGVEAPWVIFCSVVGMNAAQMIFGDGEVSRQAWQDEVLFPEILAEAVTEKTLKPILKSFPLLFGIPPSDFRYPD